MADLVPREEKIITSFADIASPSTYTIRGVALYSHSYYKFDEMFDYEYYQYNGDEKPPEDRLRPCTIVLGDAHGTCIALKILPGPWRDWLT
jgi:hypothetical protein